MEEKFVFVGLVYTNYRDHGYIRWRKIVGDRVDWSPHLITNLDGENLNYPMISDEENVIFLQRPFTPNLSNH
jgi:hypothetical protein